MIIQNLNGTWKYRIGKGKEREIEVPFSALPVGHSECSRMFNLEHHAERVFLRMEGITYAAKVYVNDNFLGEMGPYSEYRFEITDIVKAEGNTLLVELEDISPEFGPVEGWGNYGGIIRDVNLLFAEKNYIEDVFFHSTLVNDYKDAEFVVETISDLGTGIFDISLYDGNELISQFTQKAGDKFEARQLSGVKLWDVKYPNLYRLEVKLYEDENLVDTYECRVGFRSFEKDRHRFILNGKPIFLKGVCKHEMVEQSGHCPTEEQVRRDLQMIKDAGCNFVRLVHYPNHKRTLDIADELGLMVCEEPGLWWSNTANPAVAEGSLNVLRRTIYRDRNHASIMFWLCFNECRFTPQFLIASAKTTRECDPTRMVSGANCMSDQDTIIYYNQCDYDFYTMHPYHQEPSRAKMSARILFDKPLLFTEWGGFFVYDRSELLKDFLYEMHQLFLNNDDMGALAGAFFWEWSELDDFNRGQPACTDGVLKEGLVDINRKPTRIYEAFCEAMREFDQDEPTPPPFWMDKEVEFSGDHTVTFGFDAESFKANVKKTNFDEMISGKERRRYLKVGPVLQKVGALQNIPTVLKDRDVLETECGFSGKEVSFYGMTSFSKGYPLSGMYGEDVAEVIFLFEDGTEKSVVLKNGVDITTVFKLRSSSIINPVAENAERVAEFGYDKNFEWYVLNKLVIQTDSDKIIENIKIKSMNNGYELLIYGMSATS